MNKREFLRAGPAAICAAAFSPAFAQAPAAPKRTLDVWSKNIQWLRTPQQVAGAVSELGLNSINLTVQPYPGHVDPAKAAADLPPFVRALGQEGVSVTAIDCALLDSTRASESILAAAAPLGIRYFSIGRFRYDQAKPYQPQLDAIKVRLAGIAKLSEKLGMKGLYQPGANSDDVGATFFDMLSVMRGFDPRFIAFRYDTASLLHFQRDAVTTHMRLGAPYIGALALNDGQLVLDLPAWNDGPFEGAADSLAGASTGGDNVGRDGGDPLAIGGGGRPLPYKFKPTPIGTGAINLPLIGKTLLEIGFSGPLETQVLWPLDSIENGADRIAMRPGVVLGRMKRDRLTVEQTFGEAWGFLPARPLFMRPPATPAPPPTPSVG